MIQTKCFGTLKDGRETTLYTISNGCYTASLADNGATLVSFCGPDKNGVMIDVVLGFDNVAPYQGDVGSMGSVVGRFGNRIEKGIFELNGKTYKLAINNGPNHLHGGLAGFDRKLFDGKILDDYAVQFRYFSRDGEEGYPGNLEVKITYSLSNEGELTIDYFAESDADTVLNLTNHSYFNPDGNYLPKSVNDLVLQLDSSAFCDTDSDCLANGNIISVRGTPFDMRKPVKLGDVLSHTEYAPIVKGKGIDHNFVLNTNGNFMPVASLYSDKSGIAVICSTNQPGIQIYTANFLTDMTGKYNKKFGYRSAVCMETQGYPNATSFSHFPSPVLRCGEVYSRKTSYKIITKQQL